VHLTAVGKAPLFARMHVGPFWIGIKAQCKDEHRLRSKAHRSPDDIGPSLDIERILGPYTERLFFALAEIDGHGLKSDAVPVVNAARIRYLSILGGLAAENHGRRHFAVHKEPCIVADFSDLRGMVALGCEFRVERRSIHHLVGRIARFE